MMTPNCRKGVRLCGYSLNIELKGFVDKMVTEHESEKNTKDDSKASGPRKLKDRVALN